MEHRSIHNRPQRFTQDAADLAVCPGRSTCVQGGSLRTVTNLVTSIRTAARAPRIAPPRFVPAARAIKRPARRMPPFGSPLSAAGPLWAGPPFQRGRRARQLQVPNTAVARPIHGRRRHATGGAPPAWPSAGTGRLTCRRPARDQSSARGAPGSGQCTVPGAGRTAAAHKATRRGPAPSPGRRRVRAGPPAPARRPPDAGPGRDHGRAHSWYDAQAAHRLTAAGPRRLHPVQAGPQATAADAGR